MKLLDRLIYTEIGPLFLLGVLVLGGVIWLVTGPVGAGVRYLTEGVPYGVVFEIVGLLLPRILVYTFPIAMLLAAIFGFSRLSESSEAVAMFATGVSFYRLLIPTTLIALCVTAVDLAMSNTIVPSANLKIANFEESATKSIQTTDEPFSLGPLRDKDGNLLATIYVNKGYDTRLKALRDLTITHFNPATGVPVVTVHAQIGTWKGDKSWNLSGVTALGVGSEWEMQSAATEDLSVSPTDLNYLKQDQDPDTLNFAQLSRQINALRHSGIGDPATLSKAQIGLWDKLSLPCASVVFALVGAPLGLRPQRGAGRGSGVVVGIMIVAAYYGLFTYLHILASGAKVDPFVASFLPDCLGAVAALALIVRSST